MSVNAHRATPTVTLVQQQLYSNEMKESYLFIFKKKVLCNIEKQLEFEGLRDYLSYLFQFHAVFFYYYWLLSVLHQEKKVEPRYIAKPG